MSNDNKRVIVSGGRDLHDYDYFRPRLYKVLTKLFSLNCTIVHGCADGTDTLAERFRKLENLPVDKFPAKWNEHGRKAGPLRNIEMGDAGADLLVSFWDGKSTGTRHMISVAATRMIPTIIFQYKIIERLSYGELKTETVTVKVTTHGFEKFSE